MYFRGLGIYGTECDFGAASVKLTDESTGDKKRVPYRELDVSIDGGKTWIKYGMIIKLMSEG